MSTVQRRPRRQGAGRGTPKRQREVLDAAARVFHAKGYEYTSVQDIADEVGLLKGSLYHYMESKEDLLFAIMQEVHHAFMDNWREVEQEDWEPLTAARAFVAAHVRFITVNLERIGIFMREFRALGPPRQRMILEQRDVYEGILRSHIARAREAGDVPDTLDPKLASKVVFGMVNWLHHWYRPGGELSSDELAELLADAALRILTAAGPADRSARG